MTEEVAALQIRLEATTAKLERALRRGEQKLNNTARNMETRARRLDNRLSTVGSRFGGKAFQRGVQQAGFQIGDFAVQVAGGTSAITAMTQQGSQLLGAFGVCLLQLGLNRFRVREILGQTLQRKVSYGQHVHIQYWA